MSCMPCFRLPPSYLLCSLHENTALALTASARPCQTSQCKLRLLLSTTARFIMRDRPLAFLPLKLREKIGRKIWSGPAGLCRAPPLSIRWRVRPASNWHTFAMGLQRHVPNGGVCSQPIGISGAAFHRRWMVPGPQQKSVAIPAPASQSKSQGRRSKSSGSF